MAARPRQWSADTPPRRIKASVLHVQRLQDLQSNILKMPDTRLQQSGLGRLASSNRSLDLLRDTIPKDLNLATRKRGSVRNAAEARALGPAAP
jgi:hypothetical protein